MDVRGDGADGKATLLTSKVSSPWSLAAVLSGIYVAESLEEALSLRSNLSASESVVSKQGVWFGPSWVRVQQQDDATTGLLERKGIISELSNKINILEEKSNVLLEKQSQIKLQLEEQEQQRSSLQTQISQQTREFSELKSRVSADLAKLEEARLRKSRISH